MHYTYKTKGVCTSEVSFDFDGNVVTNVEFIAGCNGNLKAIASLVNGLTPDEIIKRCEGITCGPRNTSCTDQLTKGLKEAMAEFNK